MEDFPKTRNSVTIVITFCFLQNKKPNSVFFLQKLDQTPKYTIQDKPVEWRWILEIKFYQTYLYFFILILGNREASEISLVRVDGKTKYRMLILDSRGEDNGVAEPISLALHPASGRLFWLDKGQIFWEGHKNFKKCPTLFWRY